MRSAVIIAHANPAISFGLACLAERSGYTVAGVASAIGDTLALAACAAPCVVIFDACAASESDQQVLFAAKSLRRARFIALRRDGHSAQGIRPPYKQPLFEATMSDESVLAALDRARREEFAFVLDAEGPLAAKGAVSSSLQAA